MVNNERKRSYQILRSGTAIGANHREAIALEETSEELQCKNMCVVTWDTEGDMDVDGVNAPIISFAKWAEKSRLIMTDRVEADTRVRE